MDNDLILGPNAQMKAVRAPAHITGFRLELQLTTLDGVQDFVHATHLAHQTLSPDVKDMVRISPKEAPSTAAQIMRELLEVVATRYILQ